MGFTDPGKESREGQKRTSRRYGHPEKACAQERHTKRGAWVRGSGKVLCWGQRGGDVASPDIPP